MLLKIKLLLDISYFATWRLKKHWKIKFNFSIPTKIKDNGTEDISSDIFKSHIRTKEI